MITTQPAAGTPTPAALHVLVHPPLDRHLSAARRQDAARLPVVDLLRSPVSLCTTLARAALWQPSSAPLALAAGARLAFRVEVEPDQEVLWSGAREACLSMHRSVATVTLCEPGRHVIQAEVYAPDRRRVRVLRAVVMVQEHLAA